MGKEALFVFYNEEISEDHFDRARERLNTLRAQSKKPKMMDTYKQLEGIINEKAARFRIDAN